MVRSLILILVLCAGILPCKASGGTGTLYILVTGFDNTKGAARIALIDSAENWEADLPFKGFTRPITNGRARVRVDLPFGAYAVKVFHDENGNDTLDTRIFGIPAERYGFSNGARAPFGPPDFEDARFVLDSPTREITVEVAPYLGLGSGEDADDEK